MECAAILNIDMNKRPLSIASLLLRYIYSLYLTMPRVLPFPLVFPVGTEPVTLAVGMPCSIPVVVKVQYESPGGTRMDLGGTSKKSDAGGTREDVIGQCTG